MKKIILFVVLLTVVSFSSCRLYYGNNDYIKRVELGMNKKEVIKIMGNDYSRSASFVNDNGNNIEVLRYADFKSHPYMLTFDNDILIEIFQDIPIYMPPVAQPQPKQ